MYFLQNIDRQKRSREVMRPLTLTKAECSEHFWGKTLFTARIFSKHGEQILTTLLKSIWGYREYVLSENFTFPKSIWGYREYLISSTRQLKADFDLRNFKIRLIGVLLLNPILGQWITDKQMKRENIHNSTFLLNHLFSKY